MNRTFLVDAGTNRVISYDQLIEELNGPELVLPMYVYSSDIYTLFKAYLQALLFEKKVILGLVKRYPDLKRPLEKLTDRLLDLMDVISRGYCHPDFRGKYSIKSVLPVLVPELSYDDLAIGNGAVAAATFARMARGRFTPAETRRLRAALLKYCERDSIAMVRIHERLVEVA